MKLYIQSIRDGSISYSTTDGMDETTVTTLMTEIGHIDITFITEEEFTAAIASV